MEDRPEATVLQAADFVGMARGLATTTLRAVVGDMDLDEVLSKRDQVNAVLRTKLDEATEGWGVKVTRVEIREIEPPREVQEAMNRQMAAERVRRATVTEAEGERQAAITRAEGTKQANILQAEGDRQAAILRAEGSRQSAILNAEGFSNALTQINAVAQTADARTMSLQYFDTLKRLGEGAATKFIFPMEFTSMLQSFVGSVGGSRPTDGGGK
jgi:regulator of protease activity HflC (stomatin/prohibitin superfamily)